MYFRRVKITKKQEKWIQECEGKEFSMARGLDSGGIDEIKR